MDRAAVHRDIAGDGARRLGRGKSPARVVFRLFRVTADGLASLLNDGLGIVTDRMDGVVCRFLRGIAKVKEEASDIPADTMKAIGNLYEIIETLVVSDGDFDAAFSRFVDLIKENVSKQEFKKSILSNFEFKAIEASFEVGLETCDAFEDMIQYISLYAALQSTTDQFVKTLEYMRVFIELYCNDGNDGKTISDYAMGASVFPELGGNVWELGEFLVALDSTIDALKRYESEGLAAVAKDIEGRCDEAETRFRTIVLRQFSEWGLESIIAQIPVINFIIVAKEGLSVGLILSEIFTNVDEREYAADYLTKCYCISVILCDEIAEFAKRLTEDDFHTATLFDVSVNMYRYLQLLASEYAMEYTDMVLANAIEELTQFDKFGSEVSIYDNRDKLVEKVNWYTNQYKLLEAQRTRIEAITCHKPGYWYDPQSDTILRYQDDPRIYVVACPVDMIVKDENGAQIAYLSGENDQMVEGNEFYFRTIATTDEKKDYIKIAVVPNGYQVELKGIDSGEMNAFVVDFSEKDKCEVETYFNIPILKTSVGRFEAKTSHNSETILVMDDTKYSNMKTAEEIPNKSRNFVYWICGGALSALLLLAILLVRGKARKKERTSR